MVDYVYQIVDARGEEVVRVVINADDIADRRAAGERGSDSDIAHSIYEDRYESVLAKAGISYDDAVSRGYSCVTFVSKN